MGRLTQDENSIEDIFKYTNNGLDIFIKEIGIKDFSKNISSPLRIDKNPSFRVKQSNTSDIWFFIDYATGEYGNALQFIQKKYGLSYKEAINYVINNQKLNSKIQYKPKTTIIRKEGLYYEAQFIPYTQKHLDYYCIQGLTQHFLIKEMDILALEKYAINKHVKEPKEDEFMFAYVYRDINGNIIPGQMKLLTLGPNVEKKDKWRNNINFDQVFYAYKIKKDTPLVMISKSNKDSAVTQLCGITSIAVLSENSGNIIKAIKPLIDNFPKTRFILNLGTDEQAKKVTEKVQKALKIESFVVPECLLCNNINDNFEYIKNFGFESFKQLLKNKKYL